MRVRRLFILRHGKAQSDLGGGDRERPLAPQGRADMEKLAASMESAGLKPDHVVCSPARRTRETLQAALPGFPPEKISFIDKAYNSSEKTLLELAQNTPDKFQSLMIVAHNPGIHNFAVMTVNDDDPHADRLIAGYEPGTLTVVEFTAASWADIRPHEGRVVTLLVP